MRTIEINKEIAEKHGSDAAVVFSVMSELFSFAVDNCTSFMAEFNGLTYVRMTLGEIAEKVSWISVGTIQRIILEMERSGVVKSIKIEANQKHYVLSAGVLMDF